MTYITDAEFDRLLTAMSRRDLVALLWSVRGTAPEGVALALRTADVPAQDGRWCGASTTPAGGCTVYCELPEGHPGPHTAPGEEQDDPDIKWHTAKTAEGSRF